MAETKNYTGPNGIKVTSIPEDHGIFRYEIWGPDGCKPTRSAAEAALALC